MKPTLHDESPTLGDELREMIRDGSKRLVMQKVNRKSVTLKRRLAPPAPSGKLSRTKDLEAFLRQLQAKAAEYSKLEEQARGADWDWRNGGGEERRTDEVSYGALATLARECATRVKRNLKLL